MRCICAPFRAKVSRFAVLERDRSFCARAQLQDHARDTESGRRCNDAWQSHDCAGAVSELLNCPNLHTSEPLSQNVKPSSNRPDEAQIYTPIA